MSVLMPIIAIGNSGIEIIIQPQNYIITNLGTVYAITY